MTEPGRDGEQADASGAGANGHPMRRLQALALQLLDRLHVEFDVVREEGYGLDPELEQPGVVRPSIELIPSSAEAAPLTVAFTAWPGLQVRFGRWYTRAFPATAAEASDATFEDERERFLWRVAQLIEGRFREATVPGPAGVIVQQHGFWAPDGTRAGGECRVDAGVGESFVIEATIDWQPWVRRRPAARVR